MTEYLGPLVRTRYFVNHAGRLCRGKMQDEKLYESMNFSWLLEGAETISAAVFEETSGVTLSAITVASPLLSWTVEDVGTAQLKITTSAGRIRIVYMEYLAVDPSSSASDY